MHACMHASIHTYIMATQIHTLAANLIAFLGDPTALLHSGPRNLRVQFSKQSHLDSPRIKTSEKSQAQTSTSFSLKQNMSLSMRTHPETHAPLKPSQSPCRSEQSSPRWRLGACGNRIWSPVPGTSTRKLGEELGPYLGHHSVAACQSRGSRPGRQYYA